MPEFKDKDIVRYKPLNTWCRHGIALVHLSDDGTVALCDSYWSFPTDPHEGHGWVSTDYLGTADLIGNLSEFERDEHRNFSDYREEDRLYIPTGGWHEQHWYRKAANSLPELTLERLRYAVEKADSEIKHAEWHKEYAEKELNQHLERHPELKEKS